MEKLLAALNVLEVDVQIIDAQHIYNNELFEHKVYLMFDHKKITYRVFGSGHSAEEALIKACCYLPPTLKKEL